MLGRAVRLEDVDPGLGEGPREVLEQAGPVPGVDLQLDPVGGRVVARPGDVGEALGRLHQRLDVAAVLAVDRDSAAERDVADDLVARNRPAALGEPHDDVVDALDLDPEVGGILGAALALVAALEHAREACLGLVAGHRLAALEALHDLVGDRLRRDLALAEGDVEVVGLAEAHLADHVGEQRRAGDPLRRQAGLAQGGVQLLAPAALGVLAALALEQGADLVARAAGAHQREPVARRAALLLGGQDLDDVAAVELVVQRHDLAVDLGADAAVPDVGVDRVGEVERGRAGGEVLDLALRREDEDLVLEQVDLERLEELGRIAPRPRPRAAGAARSSSRARGRP